jgi:hypothetical protein
MIADTTFLVHLVREQRTGRAGSARAFLAAHRREVIRTSIISMDAAFDRVPRLRRLPY